jgi:hypothetical protein
LCWSKRKKEEERRKKGGGGRRGENYDPKSRSRKVTGPSQKQD